MMITKPLYLLAALALLSTACASSKAYRHPDFQQKVKTVAVVSVTGPERMLKTKKELAQQAVYDLAEERLVAGLTAKGLQVVPLQTSGSYVGKNFDTAFVRSLPADQQKAYDAAKLKTLAPAVEKAAYGTDEGAKVIASKQTAYVVDYLAPAAKDGQVQYSEPFRKGLGMLAKSLKADAVVVVRVLPSLEYPPFHVAGTGGESIKTVMQVAAFDADGTLVFSDTVDYSGSESVAVNGVTLPMKDDKIMAMARKGVEEDVEDIVDHLTKTK